MRRHVLRRDENDDEPERSHGDDSIFVATRSALYHLLDRDGDGKADGVHPPVRFPRRLSGSTRRATTLTTGYRALHSTSPATFTSAWARTSVPIYRLIGSDGATLSGGGEGGSIYRCRPDGSKLERVATGFWNPFHMTFDVFGRLFAVDNDPDSRPPCRLLHIVPRRRLWLSLPKRSKGAASFHRLER